MDLFFTYGSLAQMVFFAIFALAVIFFVVGLVRSISRWHRNNESPRLTVDAELVSRRTEVSTFHHGGHNGTDMCRTSSSTTYYVTFQVDSGDRMEFSVSGQEYGLLAEGDRGKLTFQGTRYLGFEREKAERT